MGCYVLLISNYVESMHISGGFGKGGMTSSHGNRGVDSKLNKLSQDW